MSKKNIVIVGGGTAGWLTALFVKKMFGTDANVTVVESEDIGILGAGEGSTPNFAGILNFLDIDFKEFVVKTNATHKLGIKFENWNGDGKHYYHPFGTYTNSYDWMSPENTEKTTKYLGWLMKNNLPYEDYILSNKLSDKNRSPLLRELVEGMENAAAYAFHFDAHLVAKYLRKVAERRKINRVEGIIRGFRQNEDGDVKKIVMKDGTFISSDFVFDCSGFSRLIIGQLYKTPWISYSDSLKVNRALPFTLPQSTTEINPYTRAVAMKYGWMWMIPLQNRWGCGYLYNDSKITDIEAKQEIEDFLKQYIEVGNAISFTAGRFEKVWVNNCIAVGLSTGFSEPIEATSIFTSVNQLFSLDSNIIFSKDSEVSNYYNEQAAKFNDNVKDFLQFHYFTKRTDTDFWKYYYESTPKSEALSKKIEKWKTKAPSQIDFEKEPFNLYNWLSVGLGLDFYNRKLFIDKTDDSIEEWHNKQVEFNDKMVDISIDEVECIELIKSLYYNG